MQWRASSATSFVGLASSNPKKFWRDIFGAETAAPQVTSEALTAYFEDLLSPTGAEGVGVDTLSLPSSLARPLPPRAPTPSLASRSH